MAGDGGTADGPLLPAAATTITPRLTAWLSASSRDCSRVVDGCATARLKLMTPAPASMHSMIAAASSLGVAVGVCGSRRHVGKYGAAREAYSWGRWRGPENCALRKECLRRRFRAGTRCCWPDAAAPLLSENLLEVFGSEIAMSVTTGPSMSPILTSGLPLVRSSSAVSLTRSRGSMRFCGWRSRDHAGADAAYRSTRVQRLDFASPEQATGVGACG